MEQCIFSAKADLLDLVHQGLNLKLPESASFWLRQQTLNRQYQGHNISRRMSLGHARLLAFLSHTAGASCGFPECGLVIRQGISSCRQNHTMMHPNETALYPSWIVGEMDLIMSAPNKVELRGVDESDWSKVPANYRIQITPAETSGYNACHLLI